MTANDYATQLLADWLEAQPSLASDRLRAAVMSDVQRTSQRGRWRATLRSLPMFSPNVLRLYGAAAGIGLIAVAAFVLWNQTGVGPPTPTSSPTPTPTPVATEAPSTLPVVETTADELGDAPADRDIVSVTTTADTETLILEVTLAQDWPTQPTSRMVAIEWVADRRPYEGAQGFWAGACNAWIATYRTIVASDGALSGTAGQDFPGWPDGAEIDGRKLKLVMPLGAFEYPSTLGMAIGTADGDNFPDDPASDGCHYIPLMP